MAINLARVARIVPLAALMLGFCRPPRSSGIILISFAKVHPRVLPAFKPSQAPRAHATRREITGISVRDRRQLANEI